jgi:hypothetical protein
MNYYQNWEDYQDKFFPMPNNSLFHAWVNPNFTKLVEIFKGGSSRGIGFKLAKIKSFQWHPWLKGCVCLTFWNGDYIHIMKIGYNFVVKFVQSSVVRIYRKQIWICIWIVAGYVYIHIWVFSSIWYLALYTTARYSTL